MAGVALMANGNGRDQLFVKIAYLLTGLIVIYGFGIGVVLFFTEAGDDVVVRYIASFGSIFAGLLGLCSGYLLGRRNGNG